jgi:CIC family chloride channel protein
MSCGLLIKQLIIKLFIKQKIIYISKEYYEKLYNFAQILNKGALNIKIKYAENLLKNLDPHKRKNSRLMLYSIIVGIVGSIAGVIMKHLVEFVFEEIHSLEIGFIYIFLPILGIGLTTLFMKYIIKRPVRHGIPNVLYSISKKNCFIDKHNMFTSIITSVFTVSFGGSVGLEGPSVATSSALGSNIGKYLKLNFKEIRLMIACAAAAVIACLFKAPVTGIIFAVEIILIDLSIATIIPLALASLSGVTIGIFLMGGGSIYSVELESTFKLFDIPFYAILGVICGLVSTYFNKVYIYIEEAFEKIHSKKKRLLIGGLGLSAILYVFPALFGEGYNFINRTFNGDISYLFDGTIFESFENSTIAVILILLAVILIKAIASSITFGAGGVGGIFAPILFLGANLGYLCAFSSNTLGTFHALPITNFALAGMTGLLAGVLHAPLTGLFLVADITGSYELFVPLMLTGIIAYSIVRIFQSNSVYTIQLAHRKELISHDKDQSALFLLKLDELIETNFMSVDLNASLGDLVEVISKSERSVYPVVDKTGKFYGIIRLSSVRDIMFKKEYYETTKVKNLMLKPDFIVEYNHRMDDIAEKFHRSPLFNIPVVKDGKYLGFISRANVFSAYREKLKNI